MPRGHYNYCDLINIHMHSHLEPKRSSLIRICVFSRFSFIYICLFSLAFCEYFLYCSQVLVIMKTSLMSLNSEDQILAPQCGGTVDGRLQFASILGG